VQVFDTQPPARIARGQRSERMCRLRPHALHCSSGGVSAGGGVVVERVLTTKIRQALQKSSQPEVVGAILCGSKLPRSQQSFSRAAREPRLSGALEYAAYRRFVACVDGLSGSKSPYVLPSSTCVTHVRSCLSHTRLLQHRLQVKQHALFGLLHTVYMAIPFARRLTIGDKRPRASTCASCSGMRRHPDTPAPCAPHIRGAGRRLS
jgi:hypothetical protein